MASMTGRTCVVTGATAGIGRVIALGLAELGGTVLAAGRNTDKGATLERAAARLPGSLRFVRGDVSTMVGVAELAEQITGLAPAIDVLVGNAGGFFWKRETTAEGLERTFALNHLGYARVVEALLPAVTAAQGRIVLTASEAHRGASLDFEDLQMASGYNGWRAYQRSKLMNILYTRAMADRLEGTGVTIDCFHPGFVASEIGDNNRGLPGVLMGLAKRIFALTPEQGADTALWLATRAEAGTGGGYFIKRTRTDPTPQARDGTSGARLLAATEPFLVGL